MNDVQTAIDSVVTFVESFWGWFDSTAVVGQLTFLDFAFGSYVAYLSLWFIFMGGDDE